MNKKVFALCLVIMTLFCISSAGAIGYTFTNGCNLIVNENKLSVSYSSGSGVALNKDVFVNAGNFDSIRIIELPDKTDGTLMCKNREVRLYERLDKSRLGSLKFVAAKDFDGSAYFCFRAVDGEKESANYLMEITKGAAKQTVVYDTLSITALPKIASIGVLFENENSAVCNITKSPKLGSVSVNADGYYVYTPTAKTGSDRFEYEVLDASGFVLATGKVNIKVEKSSSQLTFADMNMREAHTAAVKLVEAGAMESTTVAGLNFFHPTLRVTKAQFVSALSVMTDEDAAHDVYSEAVDASMPDAFLTRAEAMVMVYNILGLDASETGNMDYIDCDAVPDFAYQQMCALTEAGIVDGYDDNSIRAGKEITREEAAQLIYNAVQYAKNNSPTFWEALDVFNLFK